MSRKAPVHKHHRLHPQAQQNARCLLGSATDRFTPWMDAPKHHHLCAFVPTKWITPICEAAFGCGSQHRLLVGFDPQHPTVWCGISEAEWLDRQWPQSAVASSHKRLCKRRKWVADLSSKVFNYTVHLIYTRTVMYSRIVYMHKHVHIFIYAFIHIYIHIYMHIYMYIYIYIDKYTRVIFLNIWHVSAIGNSKAVKAAVVPPMPVTPPLWKP